MNNKKINKIIYTMVGLTAFSGALFAYDNFYLSSQNETQLIYVAKQDIPAKTVLKADMFESVKVPTAGVLPTYITNINDVVGKKLKGGLLKDEPLSKNRLTTEEDLEHNLEIRIDVDPTSISVATNDYINLYVVLNVNGDVQIKKVFDSKQVKVESSSSEEGSSSFISIKANEEEVSKYLDANERGKILIVKNHDLDADEDITDYDPNSEDAQNATPPTEEEQEEGATPTVSVVEKTFEEGDTLDELAIRYKTSVENIKKLNNNKEEFNVGDIIILPAN